MGVKLLQIVFSMPSCLLPQQSCAPWGSFVFYGAPLGSCGQKSLYVDPLMGVKLLQIVLSTASCILP